MRSVIAVAALAAGALAVPHVHNEAHKRGYVFQENVVYETKIVTVTAYGSKPTSAPAAPVYNPPAPVYQAPAPAYPQAPTSTKAASGGAAPTDYAGKVVYHHNIHRANHSAPDVEWDDSLYSCAQEIASSCVYAHNTNAQGGGYGQNIAAGVSEENIGEVITNMFYNGEVSLYNFYGSEPDMSNFEAWGHMSQIVWKGTTHVACATQYCPNGLANTGGGVSPYFTVCNYKTPGNYAGQYSQNVLAPLGNPTVSADAPGY